MHDVPYLNREVGHEITAAMSVIAKEIKSEISLLVVCKFWLGQMNLL